LVAQIYQQMPTTNGPINTMIISDCLMVCGNRCATLRYDQRHEIASEIIHKLATKDDMIPPKMIPSKLVLPNSIHPNRSYTILNTIIVDHLPYALQLKPFCKFQDIRHIPFTMMKQGSLRLNVFSVKSSISYRTPSSVYTVDCCASENKLHVIVKFNTKSRRNQFSNKKNYIHKRFTRYTQSNLIAYAYTDEKLHHQTPMFHVMDPFSLHSTFENENQSNKDITDYTVQIVWSFVHNCWFSFNIDKTPQYSQCYTLADVQNELLTIMDNPMFNNSFIQ
jgi:hypothetical protein